MFDFKKHCRSGLPHSYTLVHKHLCELISCSIVPLVQVKRKAGALVFEMIQIKHVVVLKLF